MIRPEYLVYFKDLLEGRAEISWQGWFKQHDEELARELPRMAYLNLKFHMLDEAEKLLKEAGIKYVCSPLAKRERYFASLAPSVLDDKGRPTEKFLRRRYDGAFGCIIDGNLEKGKKILARILQKIMKYQDQRRAEEMGDFGFDAEQEFTVGNQQIGRVMLELAAALDTYDDLIDHVVFRARELLGAS